MPRLEQFDSKAIDRLMSWIPDARFLLQWAGPNFRWPLDRQQFEALLFKPDASNSLPTTYSFKLIDDDTGEMIGYVDINSINWEKKTARISRVLVGADGCRGKGLGITLMRLVLRFAFDELGVDEIQLGVFDFNAAAIKCYAKVGFIRNEMKYPLRERQFNGESWKLITMTCHVSSYRLALE